MLWLFAHGIMPLYTPLGGGRLNMAGSAGRAGNERDTDATRSADQEPAPSDRSTAGEQHERKAAGREQRN